MDASPAALARILLPRTPFILKTALAHTLYLSHTSTKWDLRTELTVKILRSMLGPDSKPTSITKLQRMTTKDPGIKGRIWVSKVRCEVEEERDHVRDLVVQAVQDMGNGTETFTLPPSHALEAEWHGFRASAASDTEPEPPHIAALSEAEKYEHLMKEVTSPVTLLYFHGGAMYLLDPATYRPTTLKLARLTNGRVFSVRYRLSPQNPFPAALVDALHAYLALLYPPPGAPHSPVPANEIVIGGDSAGGLLSVALLQLLLHLHRSVPEGHAEPTIMFHGKEVTIPLPAGLVLSSPWLDVTRSLPSIEQGTQYDYLPPPSHTHRNASLRPACPAWPAKPPRADMYAEGSALCHPLVSPLAARDWKNCPPVFIMSGEEMLSDEDKVFAQRLVAQGTVVRWLQFEAMPHCFQLMMEWLGESRLAWEEAARFSREVVQEKEKLVSEGWFVRAKSLEREMLDLKSLTAITEDDVVRYMREGKRAMEEIHGEFEPMPML